MTTSAARDRIAIALVVAAAVATFANALANGFALDDNFIVGANPRVHQLRDQALIWLTPYWPGYGEELGLYRPLTIFVYALQWQLGGGAPLLFHAVNIGLHALTSVLAFALLKRLFSTGPALAGALLFAVHPVHTEVVANVVGQAELLAACAVLLGCLLHASRPEGQAIGMRRVLLIAVIWGLGMLAKEGAVVLLPLLMVLDVAQRRVRFERASIAAYARAFALPGLLLGLTLAAYFALRIHVLGSVGGVDAAPQLPFLQTDHRVYSALRAWPEYVRLLVFPLDLSADYSPGVILPAGGFTPMVVLGLFLLVATVALAFATFARPTAGLPAAWFCVTILPVSNLILPIGVLMAERVLYLPSFAASIAVAGAWAALQRALPRARVRFAIALAAVLLALLAVRSFTRNPDWDSTEAVWDSLIRDHPESYRAQWVNGVRVHRDGHIELARDYWELAYRIWPDDPELLYGLAALHLRLENSARAVELLERARAITGFIGRTHVLLSFAYLLEQRYPESLEAAIRADSLDGDPATARALKAQALEGLGRHAEALQAWEVALHTPRGDAWTAWGMYARSLARAGRRDEALQSVDSARARAAADTLARKDLDALASAIHTGCYGIGPALHGNAPIQPPSSCDDPLNAWGIVVPIAPQEVATALQNAMREGG
ncbi:MAG: tetratricopeptide repeat protein [Gemmatimonadetes bacterium]|nr:tetratricopeptide repeat protein [Gemmatimonadota bacterium]